MLSNHEWRSNQLLQCMHHFNITNRIVLLLPLLVQTVVFLVASKDGWVEPFVLFIRATMAISLSMNVAFLSCLQSGGRRLDDRERFDAPWDRRGGTLSTFAHSFETGWRYFWQKLQLLLLLLLLLAYPPSFHLAAELDLAFWATLECVMVVRFGGSKDPWRVLARKAVVRLAWFGYMKHLLLARFEDCGSFSDMGCGWFSV